MLALLEAKVSIFILKSRRLRCRLTGKLQLTVGLEPGYLDSH